jgi:uncharacterized protein YggE
MKLVRIAALAVFALGVAALAGVGLPEPASGVASEDGTDTITVTGSGSVATVPDRAQFAFGVVTQAQTARAALSGSSEQAARVIAALKSAGIAAADLQTAEVSIYPRTSDDGETIVGFTAQNTVTAVLRSLGRVGAVVDAAVGAGANTVAGPSLSRADQTGLYRSALRTAVEDARAKAQALAAAGGVTLGKVVGMVESGSSQPMPAARADMAAASEVPFEPGRQQVEALVTVTFAVA